MTKVTCDGSVRSMLEMLRTLKEGSMPPRPARFHFSCIEDVLLRMGRAFTWKPKPDHIPWARKRECYRNAFVLVQKHPSLIYCEGYANRIIPTWHAWAVMVSGEVIDPTWRPSKDLPDPQDYWGIPLKTEWVSGQVIRTKVYGVLYDRALMTDPSTEWLRPLPISAI